MSVQWRTARKAHECRAVLTHPAHPIMPGERYARVTIFRPIRHTMWCADTATEREITGPNASDDDTKETNDES